MHLDPVEQRILERVKARLGARPVKGIKKKDVIRASDTNADKMRFANYILQVLCILPEYSKDLGWRDDNPFVGFNLIKSTEAQRQHWLDAMIDAYRAKPHLADIRYVPGHGTAHR